MCYVGFSIQIYPTDDQKNKIKDYFGASRFVYNLGIDLENEEYEKSGKFLNNFDLDSKFTKLRKKPKYRWLANFETSSMRFILHDVVYGFKMFFSKYNRKPKYKNKKDIKQSMAVRNDRIYIGEEYITIPGGIGDIKCGPLPDRNIIGKANPNTKDPRPVKQYYRTRITFDGVNYYFSFQIKSDKNIQFSSVKKRDVTMPKCGTIGIDLNLGTKKDNWIVDSTGARITKPNSEKEWKKIKRLNKKYQRQLRQSRAKRVDHRSRNMEKTLAKINKYYNRIKNKKKSAMYDYISHSILDKNPEIVVIEDLKIADMICRDQNIPAKDRRKLNHQIYDASLYTLSETISYVCEANGITVIKAHSGFKSTQRCSNCGFEQEIGKKRRYACPNCGITIDRDFNSALNLQQYPLLIQSI